MLKTRADNLNQKSKGDMTISNASTTAISAEKDKLDKEKDAINNNNNNNISITQSPKKKYMFKTVSKI